MHPRVYLFPLLRNAHQNSASGVGISMLISSFCSVEYSVQSSRYIKRRGHSAVWPILLDTCSQYIGQSVHFSTIEEVQVTKARFLNSKKRSALCAENICPLFNILSFISLNLRARNAGAEAYTPTASIVYLDLDISLNLPPCAPLYSYPRARVFFSSYHLVLEIRQIIV